MTGAKDPDEFIKKFGREKYAKLIENALSSAEYRLAAARQELDLSDDKQRVAYIKSAVGQLARMQSTIEREIYAGRVAQETNVTRDAILQEAERERKRLIREKKRETERKILDPVSSIMPRERSERYTNPHSAIAEEALLTVCMSDTKLCSGVSERISGSMFSSPLLGRAFDIVCARTREGAETDMSVFSENFSESENAHLAAVLARNAEKSADAADDYIDIIQGENIKSEGKLSDEAILAAAEYYRKKKGLNNG